ncbi:MAG: alpha/beta hydrolase [Actinomycetota bacterium]|nr:alpha/beta hydrolase [Actinomycetota bacterium]
MQELDQKKAEAFAERPVDVPDGGAGARARGRQVETIMSKDGTPIAYRRSGKGPPLVLVHGAAADHGRWSPVLPALEERFTVYAIDRRGRGGSGDGDGYTMEREAEDIASVLDSIGDSVNLLGHSYGALLALETALLARNVRKLVLYDPGIEVAGQEIYPHEVIEQLEALLDKGDRDGTVVTTMREVAGLPPEVVEYMRSQPVWQARVAAAHTIPRELRAVKAYRFDPERFRDLGVPTLLLSGGDSPAAFRKAAETVDEALPDSRIVVMPGQGHAAMDTGTDLFTAEVLRFITAGTQQAPPQPRFATTRLATGPRLHYAEQGDQTGEAIIFLHGYSDSWYSFSRVLPLLSPEYHAFAFDQRGHGASDKPECCYTLDDFAADVDAFMDAVGIERAILVGHSGGTIIAPRVALNYPHRVSRLVLIGAATIAATVGANNEAMLGLAEEVRALEDPVPPEFAREFEESTMHRPVPEEFLSTAVSESLKLPARVWRDYMEGVVLAGGHAVQLREINAPTLILWGEQDAFFPREEQERLATAIADATFEVYPETGHAVHWERPERFVRDLDAFIKDTRSSSLWWQASSGP